MAHPSHEAASKHSGNSVPKSPYDGDRDPEPTLADPNMPPIAQVTPPPRDGDGSDQQ
jgi:hypothetical protein